MLEQDCERFVETKCESVQSITLDDLQQWSNNTRTRIHVAVMVEPYLSKVISGEKYIESRLTKVNISPFGRADAGDVVLFKRSGGAVLAMAVVDRVEFEYLVADNSLENIAVRYSDGLGYEPGYVETKANAKYASLLWLRDIRMLRPISLEKRGRQAWVTVHPCRTSQTVLPCEPDRLF